MRLTSELNFMWNRLYLSFVSSVTILENILNYNNFNQLF